MTNTISMNGLPEFTFDLGELDTQEEQTQQEEQDIQTPEISEAPEEEKQAEETPAVTQEEVPDDADESLVGLYNFWKEEGLLEHDGEFKGSRAEFAEILRQQRLAEQEAIQENIVNAMPEFAQSLVEYILTEGDTLTVDNLKEFLNISDTKIPEITTESQAKTYLLDKFTKLHGDQSLAEKFVEALEDDGALVEKANAERSKELEQISVKQAKKIEESKMTKAQKARIQQEFQNTLTQELQGTGWKPQVQQEVYNEIFSQNLRNKTSSIVQHPKALIKLANYLRYYDPKTGDIDEKAFANVAYSSAARELKDKIERHFGKSAAFGSTRVEKGSGKADSTQYVFAD